MAYLTQMNCLAISNNRMQPIFVNFHPKQKALISIQMYLPAILQSRHLPTLTLCWLAKSISYVSAVIQCLRQQQPSKLALDLTAKSKKIRSRFVHSDVASHFQIKSALVRRRKTVGKYLSMLEDFKYKHLVTRIPQLHLSSRKLFL